MCCLYGFYNYSGKSIKDIQNLTAALSEQAVERGRDATGIAYNNKGNLVICKEAKSGDKVVFKHPEDIVCLTGHTRHSTQGSHRKNYNNHPFMGKCKNTKFALAHNGVLMNDHELKKKHNLPKTKIETDSYVAVQMLEKQKELNYLNIKQMSESMEGSFAFSVLDDKNNLWLIKGDSPITLIHLEKLKLYVYASTQQILYKAMVDTNLFDEIKNGRFEEIPISEGCILKIEPDGIIRSYSFDYKDYSRFSFRRWWQYGMDDYTGGGTYIDDLKSIATYQGVSPDDIDHLIESGFTPDEIEEYIYCVG